MATAFGNVSTSGRCKSELGVDCGSVFVCIRAALPADGFEKNTTAQFLSTSQSPPPIAHPSSFCHFLTLSFCSLTCFLKALWRMRMGGFAMASSDKCFLFTDGLNTAEGAHRPSVSPIFLFAISYYPLTVQSYTPSVNNLNIHTGSCYSSTCDPTEKGQTPTGKIRSKTLSRTLSRPPGTLAC